MSIQPEHRRARALLSPVNEAFLDYVETEPDCYRMSAFQLLDGPAACSDYGLNRWPLFVDQSTARHFARSAVGLSQLIQGLPQRLFKSDPRRIAEFYGLDRSTAMFVGNLLRGKRETESVFARGDFVTTADGPRCLEMNMTSVLGGWQTHVWADLYPREPIIARFLERSGVEMHAVDPTAVLFAKLLEETVPLAKDGVLDSAVVFEGDGPVGGVMADVLKQSWRRALARFDSALEGEIHVCTLGELEDRRGFLHHRGTGRRIHALVEYYTDFAPQAVVLPWMQGNLKLYNGPVRALHHDKRNMALLSERQESDLFDAEERDVIRSYLPWTRLLQANVQVDYHGQRMPLEQLLERQQANLVIKPGRGFAGQGVTVGRGVSPEAWKAACEEGVKAGDFIVQEYVDALPLPFHDGASGAAPQYVIYGLFAFGDQYGGGGLRLGPMGQQAVVNAALGASEGLFYEVDRFTGGQAAL